jgi:hypothetical protein
MNYEFNLLYPSLISLLLVLTIGVVCRMQANRLRRRLHNARGP